MGAVVKRAGFLKGGQKDRPPAGQSPRVIWAGGNLGHFNPLSLQIFFNPLSDAQRTSPVCCQIAFYTFMNSYFSLNYTLT
jgi:hypothetical protein